MMLEEDDIAYLSLTYIYLNPVVVGLVACLIAFYFDLSLLFMVVLAIFLVLHFRAFRWLKSYLGQEHPMIKYRLVILFRNIIVEFGLLNSIVFFIVAIVFVVFGVIGGLAELGIINPFLMLVIESILSSTIFLRYVIIECIAYIVMWVLMQLNRRTLGQPLKINVKEAFVNEIDFLIHHIKERKRRHEDILQGGISQKEVNFYIKEIERGFLVIEKLATFWLRYYSFLPHPLDLHDIFQRMLIRSITTSDVDQVVNELKELEEIIVGKNNAEPQVVFIEKLREIHERNKLVEFIKLQKQRRIPWKRVIIGLITLIVTSYGLRELFLALYNLWQEVIRNLADIAYRLALTMIFAPLIMLIFIVIRTTMNTVELISKYRLLKKEIQAIRRIARLD